MGLVGFFGVGEAPVLATLPKQVFSSGLMLLVWGVRNALASSHRFLPEPPRAANPPGSLAKPARRHSTQALPELTNAVSVAVACTVAGALRLQCPRSADQENLPLVLNSPSVRQGRKRSPPAV